MSSEQYFTYIQDKNKVYNIFKLHVHRNWGGMAQRGVGDFLLPLKMCRELRRERKR
jgi:hypothetical protein